MSEQTPITSISGLGPAAEKSLHDAGIMSAEALRALGAHEAYAMMIETGTRPHFIGYYALHMALQGRPWNDCKGDEKKALRKRFDGLLAQTSPKSELDRFMDEIGLIDLRRSGT